MGYSVRQNKTRKEQKPKNEIKQVMVMQACNLCTERGRSRIAKRLDPTLSTDPVPGQPGYIAKPHLKPKRKDSEIHAT